MSTGAFQWAVVIELGMLIFAVARVGEVLGEALESIRDDLTEIRERFANRDTDEEEGA